MPAFLSVLTVDRLPPPFDAARAARTVAELETLAPGAVSDPAFRALLESAAGNSPHLATLIRREAAFVEGLRHGDVDEVLAELEAEALSVARDRDDAAAMKVLRVAKCRASLAIALADIAGAFDLAHATAALSRFADSSVKGALRYLLGRAAERAGMEDASPEQLEITTGLVVLAMGKLGAGELNYSSDIDVIVFYDRDRFPFTRAGEKQPAAIDLVKALVRLLSEATPDGYVFRVDLRLRPDAGATQVAISTEAAEQYYETMGQNWERAAMIKARAIAGDPTVAAQFLKALQPYVWRKSLDFAAIRDIHSIKRQIHAHGGHGEIAALGHNVKLGRGGIREIEFFVQTQQLILGGRDSNLRPRSTLAALVALRARGIISLDAERDLVDAYRFLRQVEHRLQMIDDRQTHTLPKSPDGLDHVARFMGYADTMAFEEELLRHLRRVQKHYAQLFERETPLAATAGNLVFTGVENDPETLATLARMGFTRAADIAPIIRGWHHGRLRATRSARARELLTALMPALLDALARTADPDAAFMQFDRFLTGLSAGVAVFSLLGANPSLLALIAEIAGSAPRLSDYLGRNPAVLDALLDPNFLDSLPTEAALGERFAHELSSTADYEGALDAARRFTREERFRIGLQVVRGTAGAEDTGRAYSAVAETVIAGLQPVVEEEMVRVHGHVAGGAFAVVAQGKLGGREMTEGSDLDLVFVYTYDENAPSSDGAKPLDPAAYFSRLGQRFIAALTAQTAAGPLYDVDMRLRPSGNKGPVSVRLATFAEYHATASSWTWERMALTRARVLSGPPELRGAVEAAIRASLTREADPATIIGDAGAMREKLAAQFSGRDKWDLKFAPGGMVDIEFVAQALQLVHAPLQPVVLSQNTIGALQNLAKAGMFGHDYAQALIDAARTQQSLNQVLRIAVDGPFKADTASQGLKDLLARAGDAPNFEALERQLSSAQANARAVFENVFPPPFTGEVPKRTQ
jgi:glutamate-ammonia-ligase adenylyltransferase